MPSLGQAYEIVSVNSGKVFDVSGASQADGAPVIQYTYQNGANQQWYFKTVGLVNGQEAYQIVNVNSGKVLDVTGASQADGTPLQQWSSSGGTNQQWFLNPVGLVNWQEAYEIVSVNSGKVVDVSGASTADGAPVIQYTSHDGTNQQWFLYAVASQNRSPQLVVEKKFMQNYRVASAVNGGDDVVAIRNSSGQTEMFAIGSDGNVHNFYPDTTSETGYNEVSITSGLKATTLAAGIDSQGKIIVFAASGLSLSYIVETSNPTSRWSAPQEVVALPVIPGATSITRIVAQEIAGNLYVAVTEAMSNNEYFVVYADWQTDQPVFLKAPDYPFPGDPHCFFQGNTPQNVTLVMFMPDKLYLCPLSTQQSTTAILTPSLNPISVGTVLGATGNNQTFAILEDGNAYHLLRGPDQGGVSQYNWTPLRQEDPPQEIVPFQQMVVEADGNGTAQVFCVSTPMQTSESDPNQYNVLYHWIPEAASATGYDSPPAPIHKSIGMQLGGVSNNSGTIELFAVDSSNHVTHLFQGQESTNWTVEVVETSTGPIEEYVSYATDVTVYDSAGALVVGSPVNIWASEETRITVNGATFFIDAHRPAPISTNSAGMLSIAQETGSLASPSFQLNFPSLMLPGESLVIQPSADVQNQLATVSGSDLMNATVADGSYMLADEYRTPTDTNSLASAIDQCMGMVGTPPLSATSHHTLTRRGPRRGVWYRSSGSAADLRKIASSKVEQHWRLSFEGNRVIYQALTPHEAAALRAERQATLPEATAAFDWLGDIGDVLEGAVDEIVDVVETIVSTVEGVINAAITFIVDGIQYVFNAVITLVEQAFDMVELILARVKVFFEMIFEWLAWLFAWPNILRSKEALAYTINQFLGFLQGSAAGIQTLVDSGFSTLQSQITSLFDQAVQNIAGQSTVGGYETSNEQSDPQYDTATSNNFVYNEFINNTSSAQVSSSLQALLASDPISQFAQQLTDFSNMIEGTSAFTDALTYFQNLGSNPDQIFTQLLAALFRVVQGLIEVGISGVQALTDSLLQLLQTIIGSVQAILNESWNIPFVSQFYSFITGGSTLTTLDLVALIAAIPTTIFYKISNGGFPFPDDGSVTAFENSFNSQTMLQAAGLAPASSLLAGTPVISLSPQAAQFLAMGYAISTFFAGGLTAINDIIPPPAKATGALVYANYVLTFATLGCQFPWFFTQGALDCATQLGVEYWIYIGACLEVALAAYYNNYGLSLPNLPSDTMAIIMTVYGGLSLALASWASASEGDATKIAWMIIPTIPPMAKFLRLTTVATATGYISLAVLAGLDFTCNLTAAILGFQVLQAGPS